MKSFFSSSFGKMLKSLKKDKLNIIIIVLAVLLGIGGSLLVIKNIKNRGPKEMTVSLGQAEVNIGETVKIPIEMNNNNGVYMAQVYIDYDADDISFVSYSVGEVFDLGYIESNEPGKVSIILDMQEKDVLTKKNGVIATLEFKAKISSDPGEYSLSFNQETMFIDNKDNVVTLNKTPGKITIKEKETK